MKINHLAHEVVGYSKKSSGWLQKRLRIQSSPCSDAHWMLTWRPSNFPYFRWRAGSRGLARSCDQWEVGLRLQPRLAFQSARSGWPHEAQCQSQQGYFVDQACQTHGQRATCLMKPSGREFDMLVSYWASCLPIQVLVSSFINYWSYLLCPLQKLSARYKVLVCKCFLNLQSIMKYGHSLSYYSVLGSA